MKKSELKKNGWTKDEISEAELILEKAKQHDVFFSKIVFWSAIFVVVLGNLSLSLILIPFLLVFQTWILHFFVIIIGLMMGSIYSFLITDIGHLKKKYHITASVIIPIIAIINLIIIVIVSNDFMNKLSIENQQHNQWMVSAIFSVAFILPFLIHRFFNIIKKK